MNAFKVLNCGEIKPLQIAAKQSQELKRGIWVYTTQLNSYIFVTDQKKHKIEENLQQGYHYKYYVDFSMYDDVDFNEIELPSYEFSETVEIFGGNGKYYKDVITDVIISQTKDSEREYLTENFGRIPVNQIRKIK